MENISSYDRAADRALEDIALDKFDRAPLAKTLARGILRRQKRSSSVIALQGAWGSGKSTIKNFVLQDIRTNDKPDVATPHIIEFEPWQLRDAETLFQSFFREIALKIGEDKNTDEGKKAQLARYGKLVGFGGSFFKLYGTVGGYGGLPFAKPVEAVGKGLEGLAKTLNAGAEIAEAEDKSLRDLKDELVKTMGELEQPILVVIDDIDRLDVEEMLLIFQLVKANADFPNFTYLLLMQRDAVQKALVGRMGEYGRSYLDKIVQLPIDVPPANASQRRKLFLESLEEQLNSWHITYDSQRRQDMELLWEQGLGALLLQPRDVVRLLGTLEFSLGVMKGDAELEVNLADFTALEAVRLMEPATFARLPRVKEYLTNIRRQTRNEMLSSGLYSQPRRNDPAYDEQPGEKEMQQALSALTEGGNEAVRNLLTFVFPKADWALGTAKERFWDNGSDRHDARLRAERYFDRYFALSIPEDQLSQSELQRFIEAAGDEMQLRAKLSDLRGRKLISLLIHELSPFVDRIAPEKRETFLATILDFCESNDLEYHLRFLFSQVLSSEQDFQQRGHLLARTIERTQAFALPSLWVAWQEKALSRSEPGITQWATTDQLKDLREQLTQRIREGIRHPEFWRIPFPFEVIRFWESTHRDEVKSWINEQVAQDDELKVFLVRFHTPFYGHDNRKIVDNAEFIPLIFDLLEDVGGVCDRLEKMDKAGWSDDELTLARRFLGYGQNWIERQNKVPTADNERVSHEIVSQDTL